MALLGTLIDLQSASRAGDDTDGVILTTYAHNLGTNPESTFLQMRSVEGGLAHNPAVGLLAPDANASLASIGFYVSSCASTPTVFYRAMSLRFHSTIR